MIPEDPAEDSDQTGEKGPNASRIFGLTLLCLFLGCVPAAAWFFIWKNQSNLSIPAGQLRPWAEERWEEFTADRSRLPVTPAFPPGEFFDAHSVKIDGEGIHIELNSPKVYLRRPSFEHYDLRTGQGSVRPPAELQSIGIRALTEKYSGAKPLRDLWDGHSGPVAFFRLNGEPIPAAELPKQKEFRRQGVNPGHPRLFFRMNHSGHPNLKIDETHVFDRRTHVDLSQSGVTRPPIRVSDRDETVVTCDYLSWRRNGALLTLDLSFGEPVEALIAAKNGEEVSLGVHTCRILAVEPKFDRGGGSSRRQLGVQSSSYDRGPAGSSASRDRSAFLIAAYPYAGWSSLEFECLDAAGNPLETRAITYYQMPYLVECEADLAEIARIRIRARPRYGRVLIPLPDLPVLPPENDFLTDLRDMRIPYARDDGPHRYRELVCQLGQLSRKYYAESTVRSWPVQEHENLTLGDLVGEMPGHYPPKTRVRIDPEECALQIGRPSRASWWKRFRDWWGSWIP